MQPGDAALVFRLTVPPRDLARAAKQLIAEAKRKSDDLPKYTELGLLERLPEPGGTYGPGKTGGGDDLPFNRDKKAKSIDGGRTHHDTYPDEVSETESYIDGATKQVSVNAFERDPKARKTCVKHWGCKCAVCNFDFKKTYGEIGAGFIHVHHIKPLSSVRQAHAIDPVTDLVPVCPNCHAMLHRRNEEDGVRTVEELKRIMEAHK